MNNLNTELQQITIYDGNDKDMDWYSKKIRELAVKDEDYPIIPMLTSIISEDSRFKYLNIRFVQMQLYSGVGSTEGHCNFWKFIYNFIPKNFFPEASATLIKTKRNIWLTDTRKKKLSWISMALKSLDKKSNGLLARELSKCKHDYIDNEGDIFNTYKVNSPDELVEYRKNWFNEWLNHERLMTEYPYLKEFSETKRLKAFELDIKNCITSILMEHYNYDISRIQCVRTDFLIKAGVFAINARVSIEFIVKKIEGRLVYEAPFEWNEENSNKGTVGSFTKNSILSFDAKNLDISKEDLLKNEFLKFIIDNTLSSKAYKRVNENVSVRRKIFSNLTLDIQDLNILDMITSNAKGANVKLYLVDIIEFIGLATSTYSYRRIEGKLLKFPGYWYSAELSNDEKISFNFINSVAIRTDEGGIYADIAIGSNLQASISKGLTRKLYAKELSNLETGVGELLAYAFQLEKSNLIEMGEDIYNKTFTYSIDYLKQYVYLNKRQSLRKSMDILEEGINDLINNHLLIKSSERSIDFFSIRFLPTQTRHLIQQSYSVIPEYMKK